jgi:HK97 family phage major capsid protein
VDSLDANLLTYRGLRKLHYTLRAPYRDNGTYAMNSLTYGDSILGLESTGGTYVFMPGLEPGTLFGRPIEFCELLDAVSADNHPIVFGDFAEGYTIAEESTLRILRSDEKFLPQVGFLPTMEVGGKTTQEAAFLKQKVAA